MPKVECFDLPIVQSQMAAFADHLVDTVGFRKVLEPFYCLSIMLWKE